MVVGSSPTVGGPVRTGEHWVCLRETLGGCTRVHWERSGVPQRSVNALETKNKIDICQEVSRGGWSSENWGTLGVSQRSPGWVHQGELGEKWCAPKKCQHIVDEEDN